MSRAWRARSGRPAKDGGPCLARPPFLARAGSGFQARRAGPARHASTACQAQREDDLLGDAVVAMETKFKKYWFGGIHTEPSPKPDRQPLPTSWTILKRRKKDKSASSYSSTTRSAASSGAELNRFLEAQFDADENTENFDLLLWWKTYSYRYLVLSYLACDILVIPVSTVSSEHSMSGRIIEPRRNCLTPEMVEVLICIRDWEHARKRMQNETVDEQFIQNFSNLYVDEGSASNQTFNTSGPIIEPRRTTLTFEMVEVLTYLWDWEHARMRMKHQIEDEEVNQNFANLYLDEGLGSNQEKA
ncbi:hypothetical protein Dsin_012915 [Dipteronia sinensis]|uniref:HAT C-terminal dimerisation domain-containing protein n=1 Tax=Dipteronia sinensis TaxID=43782 RepID=A0AAE0AJT1_9ROSI|nr:hypothetical protein Dsin_012915 [Dipteronia sinensis]